MRVNDEKRGFPRVFPLFLADPRQAMTCVGKIFSGKSAGLPREERARRSRRWRVIQAALQPAVIAADEAHYARGGARDARPQHALLVYGPSSVDGTSMGRKHASRSSTFFSLDMGGTRNSSVLFSTAPHAIVALIDEVPCGDAGPTGLTMPGSHDRVTTVRTFLGFATICATLY
jgi:hypothetical protein